MFLQYSLVPQAKAVLATTPGLVSALVSVADTLPTNNFPSFSRQSAGNHIIDCKSVGLQMTEACRFNAIATLTNLASMERNRIKMLAVPCLVDTIARVVHHESSDIARQVSLSFPQAAKLFAESSRLGFTPTLLELLVCPKLAAHGNIFSFVSYMYIYYSFVFFLSSAPLSPS